MWNFEHIPEYSFFFYRYKPKMNPLPVVLAVAVLIAITNGNAYGGGLRGGGFSVAGTYKLYKIFFPISNSCTLIGVGYSR